MKVYGFQISDEQLADGVGAMSGIFRLHAVQHALVQAGVPQGAVASRAADRLLQRERKAGRVQTNPENKREWIGDD